MQGKSVRSENRKKYSYICRKKALEVKIEKSIHIYMQEKSIRSENRKKYSYIYDMCRKEALDEKKIVFITHDNYEALDIIWHQRKHFLSPNMLLIINGYLTDILISSKIDDFIVIK